MVFENQPTDQVVDTGNQQPDLTVYIGEGKKYKDLQEADKAFGHLNKHVETIQRENAELRAKIDRATELEQVLEAIKQQKTFEDKGQSTTIDRGNQQEDLTAVIQQAVENSIATREHARTVQQNAEQVRNELVRMYGTRAEDVYKAKSQELGINLDDLVQKSPKAVLSFFEAPKQPTANPFGQGTINTGNLNTSESKYGTHAYWEQQHKDKKISREEKFLRQHESLTKLGADAYFKK